MIIITGGAGFIGANIAAMLYKSGREIAIIDRLGSEEKWRNIAAIRPAHILPPDQLGDFLHKHRAKIEMVIHMGASSSTTEKNVDFIIENNFTYSLWLWQWCTTHQKRLIYASSAATYGKGEHGFDDNETLEYLDKLSPLNPYGWSKALTDSAFLRNVSQKNKPQQWVGLKFFNVYGPYEAHKGSQRSVAHQLFQQIEETGEVKLFKSANPNYEDGGQMRDFIYVKDCCEIIRFFIDNPGVNGIYNAGSGKARSFLDLAYAAFATMKKPVKINWMETPDHIAKHYQYFTEANMNKIKQAGFQTPLHELEAGIEDYYQYFLLEEQA